MEKTWLLLHWRLRQRKIPSLLVLVFVAMVSPSQLRTQVPIHFHRNSSTPHRQWREMSTCPTVVQLRFFQSPTVRQWECLHFIHHFTSLPIWATSCLEGPFRKNLPLARLSLWHLWDRETAWDASWAKWSSGINTSLSLCNRTYHGNPKPSFLGVITHILGV